MSHRFALFATVIAIVIPGLGTHAQQSRSGSNSAFSRAWVMTASDSEIRGFIDGYYDCLPDPALRKLPGWGIPTEAMADKIRAFYAHHKASTLDVAHVALRVAANTPAPHQTPGGEVYTNRHGFFDDLWWNGAFGIEQPGYVEGYLVCLGHPVTKPAAERLADGISAWYRQHPAEEDRAIAYVLEDLLKAKKDSHRRKKSSPR